MVHGLAGGAAVIDSISGAVGPPARRLLIFSSAPVREDAIAWFQESTKCGIVDVVEDVKGQLPHNRPTKADVVVVLSTCDHTVWDAIRRAYADSEIIFAPPKKAHATKALMAHRFTPAPMEAAKAQPALRLVKPGAPPVSLVVGFLTKLVEVLHARGFAPPTFEDLVWLRYSPLVTPIATVSTGAAWNDLLVVCTGKCPAHGGSAVPATDLLAAAQVALGVHTIVVPESLQPGLDVTVRWVRQLRALGRPLTLSTDLVFAALRDAEGLRWPGRWSWADTQDVVILAGPGDAVNGALPATADDYVSTFEVAFAGPPQVADASRIGAKTKGPQAAVAAKAAAAAAEEPKPAVAHDVKNVLIKWPAVLDLVERVGPVSYPDLAWLRQVPEFVALAQADWEALRLKDGARTVPDAALNVAASVWARRFPVVTTTDVVYRQAAVRYLADFMLKADQVPDRREAAGVAQDVAAKRSGGVAPWLFAEARALAVLPWGRGVYAGSATWIAALKAALVAGDAAVAQAVAKAAEALVEVKVPDKVVVLPVPAVKPTLGDFAWLRQQPELVAFRAVPWGALTGRHHHAWSLRTERSLNPREVLIDVARQFGGSVAVEDELVRRRLWMVAYVAKRLPSYTIPPTPTRVAHYTWAALSKCAGYGGLKGLLYEAVCAAGLPWGYTTGGPMVSVNLLQAAYDAYDALAAPPQPAPPQPAPPQPAAEQAVAEQAVAKRKPRVQPQGAAFDLLEEIARTLGGPVTWHDLAWLRQQPELKSIRAIPWSAFSSWPKIFGEGHTDEQLLSAAYACATDDSAPESPAATYRFTFIKHAAAALRRAGGFWSVDAVRIAQTAPRYGEMPWGALGDNMDGAFAEAAALTGLPEHSAKGAPMRFIFVAAAKAAAIEVGHSLSEEAPVSVNPATPMPIPLPLPSSDTVPVTPPWAVLPPPPTTAGSPGTVALAPQVVKAITALKAAMDANYVRSVLVDANGYLAEIVEIHTARHAW